MPSEKQPTVNATQPAPAPAPVAAPSTATAATSAPKKPRNRSKKQAPTSSTAVADAAPPNATKDATAKPKNSNKGKITTAAESTQKPPALAATQDAASPQQQTDNKKPSNRSKNKKNNKPAAATNDSQVVEGTSTPVSETAASESAKPASKRWKKGKKNQSPAPVEGETKPSPPPAPVAPTGPALSFAPPLATLSDSVRSRIDAIIASSSQSSDKQHLVVHIRKGLEQIENFMRRAHTDSTGAVFPDFESMAASHSDKWHQHLDHARSDTKEMHVNLRLLQPSLQLNMSGYDLKVGRPGRPDDVVYQKSEYARKFMPRGNFIAEWTAPMAGRKLYFPLIRAYRKFTGQEDDGEEHGKVGDELLSKFFTKSMSQTTHVISTTKENGEAAHLAVIKRSDGEYLFVVGSKNTHMVVTSIDDVDAACAAGTRNGSNPYLAAAPIARALLRTISTLAPNDREFLCELLAQTRMTASFEMLCPGYQHVQLLDYLTEDTPVFYGLSFPFMDEMEGVEICVNPVLAYELMRSIGIRTVAFKIVEYTPDVMAQTLLEIRMAYQHEGAVNLFLDDRACIIGMEKFKTVWYVCLRAIREKAKSYLNRATKPATAGASGTTEATAANTKKKKSPPAKTEEAVARTTPVEEIHVALRKRFTAIKAYLDLTPEQTAAYLALGCAFVTYLHDVRLAACGDDKDAKKALKEHVATMFPVAWKEFLAHTKLDDRVL